jgi:hypothetical protein
MRKPNRLEREQHIRQLFEQGMGPCAIARHLQITKGNASERLKKLGLVRTPPNPLAADEWDTLRRLGKSPSYTWVWPIILKLMQHHGVLRE